MTISLLSRLTSFPQQLITANISKMMYSTTRPTYGTIANVVVIGSGLMGSGICQVTALAGQKVTLVDIDKKILDKAQKSINMSLERMAKKQFKDDIHKAGRFVSETMGHITFATNVEDSVAKCDLVIEAIIEKLDVKKKLFQAVDMAAPSQTILASNTSSLPISDIASSTQRKDRFVGLHFFNPVPMMKLLEVIRIPETSEDTFKRVMEWGQAIGKQTVSCKDTPGFIVNRLLVPYMMEAIRLLERGDASARDIDIAMKLGAGYPMGPFELLDYVGLDTCKFIIEGWGEKYPENPLFKPVLTLNRLVDEGKLGMKTGEGFYKYEKK